MNAVTKYQKFIAIIVSKNTRLISTSIIVNKDENLNIIHPESLAPGIPQYEEKISEDIETKKARLLYQSRKRGMLENGLLLSTFAQKYLNTFNNDQLKMYDRLINLPSNDWDIYNWATESKETPKEFDNEIMSLFKKHVKNEEKQARIKQPDLYT